MRPFQIPLPSPERPEQSGREFPCMKITKVSVYQIDVPIKPATISHDRVMAVFDETIVGIETDASIEGRCTRASVPQSAFGSAEGREGARKERAAEASGTPYGWRRRR